MHSLSRADAQPVVRNDDLRRPSDLRLAIVHDWFPSLRGGERVAAEMCRLFGATEVFTLFDFLSPETKAEHFPGVTFHTSPANRIPFVERYYRGLFFLCPALIEQFDVTDYDLVVSSSAAFSRGVLTRPDQPHLCYVHSPVRYAWDEQFSYLNQARLGFGPKGILFRYFLHRLRTWDARTAHGPDLILANSSFVRARIRQIYGRSARTVFPPVPIEEVEFAQQKDDYYVTASYLSPYKRTDLVIQAFNRMPSRHLVVVGEGQQERRLRELAGPNISFVGHLPRSEYLRIVAHARAMVFAGCEDFGITLAEAQASGTPLIAFGRGGARDIVRILGEVERPSGLLFKRQTVEAVKEAVEHFECCKSSIHPEACRQNAVRFSVERFRRELNQALDEAIALNRRRNAISPPAQ
ncbi:glycosyltransferase [Microvirga massiliensis]|uniref:glycosyltransferase n=1 Tax=Microvirga massiliensis TaxID=1033741 RepID=UPI003CC7F9E9